MTADTSSSDRRIVDFASHIYPDAVLSEREASENPLYSMLGDRLSDPEELIAHHERAGIDVSVLSTPAYMGHDDRAETEHANDALFDLVDGREQLRALAALPVGAGGEAAAAELERCLDAGFNGGALETESGGTTLTDAELEPVLEVAARTGAPLLVHPKLHDSLAPGALDDTHFYNAVYGREVALATALSDVVYEEILDSYPGVNLVFHHFGGNIASMLGRVYVHADRPRWPFKERLVPYDEFAAGLREVYIDTSGYFDFRAPFRAALSEFDASQVLFATDFPFEARSDEDMAAYVDAVADVAAPDETARVFADNATDLLVNT